MFLIRTSKFIKEFFIAPLDSSIGFQAGKIPVHREAGIYCIESLVSLHQLLAKIRFRNAKPILRFLVDTSGVAWFAAEHDIDIDAPKHFQMTGKPLNQAYCLTAGNLKFKNSKCKILKSINHKSGDFQPSFHSLRFFLAILILNENMLPFKLPKVLVIKELRGNGDIKHYISISFIKNWVKTINDNQTLLRMLTNQNLSAKQVQYQAISNML